MYEAPIEIVRAVEDIIKQVNEGTDKAVCQAVIKCGVNVNKEELIKALQYDRQQYKKGYADGVREFAGRVKKSAFDCDVSFGFGKECYTEAVAVVEIDNVLKEMVGD